MKTKQIILRQKLETNYWTSQRELSGELVDRDGDVTVCMSGLRQHFDVPEDTRKVYFMFTKGYVAESSTITLKAEFNGYRDVVLEGVQSGLMFCARQVTVDLFDKGYTHVRIEY